MGKASCENALRSPNGVVELAKTWKNVAPAILLSTGTSKPSRIAVEVQKK